MYTSLCVVDVSDGRFVLREKLAAISLEDLQSGTGATLHRDGDVGDLVVPELGELCRVVYIWRGAATC
ncbi:hypothetical protein [Sulfitobacter sp. 20_GPM-1509m]|uniref:hypothetical protein n=1 Tax=Sulfitobacter sp. 20_GPM-1509m TaxID=1380367 RepID=UPI0004902509